MTKVLDMADDTNYITSEVRPKSDNLKTNFSHLTRYILFDTL